MVNFNKIRTAAAGAIAANLAPGISSKDVVGMSGTGNQAKLQAEWISHHIGIKTMVALGRTEKRSKKFSIELSALGIDCKPAKDSQQLSVQVRMIVTTTPSTQPILLSDDVPDGLHIAALGADSPRKQELDPKLLERAKLIVTDDHQQCLAHGEFGSVYRVGAVNQDDDIALGHLLSDQSLSACSAKDIAIVDLTGLGAQDLAIAMLVWDKLG